MYWWKYFLETWSHCAEPLEVRVQFTTHWPVWVCWAEALDDRRARS